MMEVKGRDLTFIYIYKIAIYIFILFNDEYYAYIFISCVLNYRVL